ncbi:MAG: hypothetical protein FI687_00195 [SAR202 cluster bacterium]|nr:hypothetical protein [SAR202 cluster bacterium]|tara:strand:- start:31818 stop:34349 length:2532 start_codon:yes stop_codon:yes gene_type:complete
MTNNHTTKNNFDITIFSKFSPNQGWGTFAILLCLMVTTGYSLREGTWVPTPGLIIIIFSSTTLGMVISKISPNWIISFFIGIITGTILCIHFLGTLTEANLFIDKAYEISIRLEEWYLKISQGGISQDTLPLSLAILGICWIMGFFGSWFTFKLSNPWLILLIAGIAILTNLSFLPEKFNNRFFIFMLFGLILLSQTHLFNKKNYWISSGFYFKKNSSNLGISIICIIAFLVVLASSSLPLQVITNKNIIKIWNSGRAPLSSFEEDFSRIFSVIDSKTGSGGRFFGETLPFQGKIAFQNKTIATVTSENQNYWVSKIYNFYTNEGWLIDETSEISLPAFKKLNNKIFEKNQTYENNEIETIFTTKSMLSTGSINQINIDGSYQILTPKKFEINLYDSTNNEYLPKDLIKFSENLKSLIAGKTEPEIKEIIINSIPKTVSLISTYTSTDSNNTSKITSIKVERKQQDFPEVIGLNSNKLIQPNQKYIVSSYIYTPENNELENIDGNFPPFITDHYLQLPPDLPKRISELAKSITINSDTQLDKVFAIRDHLRNGTYIYSQNIDRPPLGEDGVDYFLFDSQKGYSDYFGSAMVVLLRTLNIPARMVAGYSNGTKSDQPMIWEIKDSDSHGWAQVYFNQYGWLNFEPTPNYPTIRQKENTENDTENLDQLGLLQDSGISNPQTNIECENSETIMDESLGLGVENCDDEIFLERLRNIVLNNFSRNIALAFLCILGIISIFWYIWNEKYSKKTKIQIMYSKVKKLGILAGIKKNKYQTPHEYSNIISNKIPKLKTEINSITTMYEQFTYGNNIENISGNNTKIETSWKNFRKIILLHIIKKQFVSSS